MVGGLGVFATIVQNLDKMGFYGFVLPWLLVFAVMYAILKKAGLDDKINGIISLTIAFFITTYSGIGTFFISFLGPASMILVVILLIVVFFELVGFKIIHPGEKAPKWQPLLGITILVIALIVGSVYAGILQLGGAGVKISGEVGAAIFMIIVMILVVWFVTSSKGTKSERSS